jgi:pimeloyl-ACP methyl ester carboxylesterase
MKVVRVGAAGLALLVPTSTAGAGWYFANRVVDATRPKEYPIQVRSVAGREVTLTRTDDTERPIPLALLWPGGHAQLGSIVREDRAAVVREVVDTTGNPLRAGIRAYTSSSVFGGDPHRARGLDFDEVIVPGELGDQPAWLVRPPDPARTAWVIAVHGRGGNRTEALRVLPALCRLGLTTLVITYRNDECAPASPDRRYHLGDTEWREVASAIRYARQHGATEVVLYGWSMGGAMSLLALRRMDRTDASTVRALVLDCPVLDWAATLRMQARQRRLPVPLLWTAQRFVEQRIGISLSTLDQRGYAASLSVPVLMFTDSADGSVDLAPAREFAVARPDLVTLVETHGAGHCRSWNLDPAKYESELGVFLDGILGAV